jgi:hypothetical protein
MSQGITSLREGLHKLFGDTQVDEENAKNRLRNDMAGAFAEAGFKVEDAVFDRFKNLSDKEFEQFFKNFKDISRYEELEPEKQRELLKQLAPFFKDFLFVEEDPQDEDRPRY